MKKACTIGKRILCLLFCCSMLTCAAFAAGPEQYQTSEATITFEVKAAPGFASREELLLEIERTMLERGTLDDPETMKNARQITELVAFEVDGVTVNPDVADAPLQPYSTNSTTLICANGTCTYTRPFRASGVCAPEYGDNLDIFVHNEGDTTLNVKVILEFSTETVTYNKVLTPDDPSLHSILEETPGNGLSCICTIEITPQNQNQTGSYGVSVCQY